MRAVRAWGARLKASRAARQIYRAHLWFESWMNSSLYDLGKRPGDAYERFAMYMDRFHVSGWKRVGVELACEA